MKHSSEQAVKKSEVKKDTKVSAPSTKKDAKSSETVTVKAVKKVRLLRPTCIYEAATDKSPLIGVTSGVGVVREITENWIKLTIGVPEKGAVLGYVRRSVPLQLINFINV